MQRILVLSAFAALLFGVGLLAGQGVHSPDESLKLATPQSPPGMDNAESDSPFQAREFPIVNASHKSIIDEGAEFESAASLSEDFAQTAELQTAQLQTDNPENRSKTLELIKKVFPDADAEIAEIWADSYSGMDLAEVEFILEQKRAMSGGLNSPIFSGITSYPSLSAPSSGSASANSTALMAQEAGALETSLRAAIDKLDRNLASAWSIGYCQMIVLPEAIQDSQSPGMPRPDTPVTTLRDFSPGKIIGSPVPTHAAIANGGGREMFVLEGDLFTRRGDFQLLPDRKLGLATSHGCYPLKNSPVIPEDAIGLHIFREQGTAMTSDELLKLKIRYKIASGEVVTAGEIDIVEIAELDRLTTTDGVIFATQSTELNPLISTYRCGAGTCVLELSNVDRAETLELRQLLQSMLPEQAFFSRLHSAGFQK